MLQRWFWGDAAARRPHNSSSNRRRSPRISALQEEASSHDGNCRKQEFYSKKDQQQQEEEEGTARIKRKRHSSSSLSLVASSPRPKLVSQVGNDIATHPKDESTNSGKKASIIPHKLVLELVLDTLQRRDTYEIFAEPVDPNEVDDYYQIIKEPMDFGTMRAKLHEGMYENLEQFKRDVFLITKNAMHFNSSATIYFRQARAIHELSKRVFHVLETDPEKFELEFLGTRRRSTRRAHNEVKDCRLFTDIKPKRSAANVSSKDTPRSVETSIPGRNVRGSLRSASVGALTDRRNTREFFSGARDGRRPNNIEADRRGTYSHQSCSFHPDNNPVGSNCFSSKLVLLTNEQDVDYRESLLLFVKDLGPIPQMIATRKIEGWPEVSPTCRNAGSNSWVQAPRDQVLANKINSSDRFTDSVLGRSSVLKKSTDMIDSTDAEEGELVALGQRRRSDDGGPCEGTADYNDPWSLLSGTSVLTSVTKSSEFLCDATSVGELMNSSSVASNNNMRTKWVGADVGKLDQSVGRPVILALEHSHANSWEYCKSRSKKISCTASSTPWVNSQGGKKGYTTTDDQTNQVNKSRNRWGSSNEEAIGAAEVEENDAGGGGGPLTRDQKPYIKPAAGGGGVSAAGFTFNMRFLEAQLHQMNARFGTSMDGKSTSLLTRGGGGGGAFEFGGPSDSISMVFPNKETCSSSSSWPSYSSLNALDNQLALQL